MALQFELQPRGYSGADTEMNINQLSNYINCRCIEHGISNITGFGKCIYFSGEEIVKFFIPKEKKKFGHVVLSGDIGFILKNEFFEKNEINKNKKSLSICPIMNFPKLIAVSGIENSIPSKEFKDLLCKYIEIIPDTMAEVKRKLGQDFF